MSEIRKASLLIIEYNQGKINAYELVDKIGTLFNECEEGAINIICNLNTYRGTKEELISEFNDACWHAIADQRQAKSNSMENWIHITFQNTNTDQVITDSINTDDPKYLASAIAQWIDNGFIILGIEFDEQAAAQAQDMSDEELETMAAYFEGGEQ